MRGGAVVAQISWANRQRVRNRQPLGRLMGLGNSPLIGTWVYTWAGSGTGTAASKARVYGWVGRAIRVSVGPVSTKQKRHMTKIRSDMYRATAMSCVMNTYGFWYLSRRSSMRFITPARIDTSSMLTGSSAMMIFGWSTIARAIATRCRWPPESSCGNRWMKSWPGRKPASSRARMTSSARCSVEEARWCITSGSATVRKTVYRGFSDSYGSWKIICRSRRNRKSSPPERLAMSTPSNWMWPSVGSSRREMRRPVVVLPHPDSPTRLRISLSRSSKLMPSTAWTWRTLPRSDCRNPLRSSKYFFRPLTRTTRRPLASAGPRLPPSYVQSPLREKVLREVAERPMPDLRDDVRWRLDGADVFRILAPGMKPAARRGRQQARRAARDRLEAVLRPRDARERTEQALRVRMQDALEDVLRGAFLDNLARVHDRDPVGDLRDDGDVVGDDDDRHVLRLLNSKDLIHDLCGGDDVESRRRLIHDHELGVEGECHRDHGPLLHSAAVFVRVVVDPVRRNADELVQTLDSFPRRFLREVFVGSDRFDDLCAHGVHGIERVHGALEHDRDLLPAHGVQFRIIVPQPAVPSPDHVHEIPLLRRSAESVLRLPQPLPHRQIPCGAVIIREARDGLP